MHRVIHHIKAIVQDQLCYAYIFVAYKNRMQEGAIISTTWLSKTCYLYKPKSDKPSLVKIRNSTELEKALPKEPPISLFTTTYHT